MALDVERGVGSGVVAQVAQEQTAELPVWFPIVAAALGVAIIVGNRRIGQFYRSVFGPKLAGMGGFREDSKGRFVGVIVGGVLCPRPVGSWCRQHPRPLAPRWRLSSA